MTGCTYSWKNNAPQKHLRPTSIVRATHLKKNFADFALTLDKDCRCRCSSPDFFFDVKRLSIHCNFLSISWIRFCPLGQGVFYRIFARSHYAKIELDHTLLELFLWQHPSNNLKFYVEPFVVWHHLDTCFTVLKIYTEHTQTKRQKDFREIRRTWKWESWLHF